MSTNSKIEWTDATWNPVRGCTLISPGCAHCYAQTFAERFRGVPGHPYEQGFDLRLVPEKLTEPLTWTKPQMVFVNSMSDLFHKNVPDEYIVLVARVMAAAKGRILPAESLGKQKTSWQIVTIIFFLALMSIAELHYANETSIWWLRAWGEAGPVLVWITVALTIYSGLGYAWRNRELLAPDQ